MLFEQRLVTLKDGRTLEMRSPREEDAAELIRYMVDTAGETHFLLCTPEERAGMPVEKEVAYIRAVNEDPCGCMICAFVDGKLAGNCHVTYSPKARIRHRGSVAIALRKAWWGLGVGAALMNEMIALAQAWGLQHLDLEYVEGNERARRLYEKCGFRETYVNPDAIRLEDGTLLALIGMHKLLDKQKEEHETC